MPPSSRRLWVWVEHALRRSFGHPLSVQLLALISLMLLLIFVLFSLTPWMDDEYQHHLRIYQPSTTVQFDSFAKDHLVVFAVISPPVVWLLLVHVTFSSVSSRIEVALLFLRVASCLTVSFALTVLLTELLSRRAILALGALAYASLGLLYSWSFSMWKWYQKQVRTKGLVQFLPQSTQELLLQTSLLDWLTDTSFSEKVAPFLPFLLPLTRAEQMRLMEQMPPESQVMMTKPGLLPLLPDPVQKALLPAENSGEYCDSDKKVDGGHESEENLAETNELRTNKVEQKKLVTSTLSATAGFDFHRPDVMGNLRTPSSRKQVLNEIVTSRMWSGCRKLVGMPTSKALNRTAAMSSALVVMQLYASRGSRKVFLMFVQFIATSALSSVACCAIFLRFVQLLDLKWTSRCAIPLQRYVRQYLLRNGNARAQLSNQPACGDSVTLRTAASSVSVVVAALYLLRSLRR